MSGKPIDEAVETLRRALVAYDQSRTTMQSLAGSVRDFLAAYVALTAAQQQEQAVAVELMRYAERYRFLRGDHGPTSSRWPRWQVQHWTGYWNPVQGSEMDAAIDAAMREAGS